MAICPGRSTWTPTSSRARATGIAARRRSSKRLCGHLGSRSDTTVILYGRDTEGEANEKWPGRRAGQIAATRAALILSLLRRRRRAPPGRWLRRLGAGRPPARDGRAVPDLGRRRSAPTSPRPELIADIEEAKQILADPEGAALVSVRTWNEHIGEVSGYNYIATGRPNRRRRLGQLRHRRLPHAALPQPRQHDAPLPGDRRQLGAAGITADKWVAFYCGTGWRASETWFYAHLMGWPTSPSTTAAGWNGAALRARTRSKWGGPSYQRDRITLPNKRAQQTPTARRSSRRTKRATSRPRCIPLPATAEQGGHCLFRHLRERHRRRLTSSLRM